MRRHLMLRNVLLVLLAVSALALTVEDLLNTYANQSLCQTVACGVVGSYVLLGESLLTVAGVFYFALLWALVFFAGRYEEPWLWGGASLVLLGGLAFDGGLLGFQFVYLREFCALCTAVAGVLFLALFLYAGVRRSLIIALLGVAVWTGGFAANSVLTPPKRTPTLDKTVLLSSPADENATPMQLFFSLDCPACANVMLSLGMRNPRGVSWRFSVLDSDGQALERMAHAREDKLFEMIPFLSILRGKVEEEVPPIQVPSEFKNRVQRAQTWFVNSGYKAVPLLLVRETPGRNVVLKGSEAILEYLVQQGLLPQSMSLPAGVTMVPGTKEPPGTQDQHPHP